MAKNITIQHKRSSVAGKKPTSLSVGELAINFADKSIYTQDTFGNIIELERDIYKATTSPLNPSAGDLWFDTGNNALKYYDGVTWWNTDFSGAYALTTNLTANGALTGTGTSADPFKTTTFNAIAGNKTHVETFTITGLEPGQFIPIIDTNSVSNEGRFTISNRIVDSTGTLTFSIFFNDMPSTTGSTYTANIDINAGDIFIKCIGAVGANVFPQSVNMPSGIPYETTAWTSGNNTLTSTGDILISKDGVTFTTGPLVITTGETLYTKWNGGPGSGVGIDSANGTTITGSVVDINGAIVNHSIIVDKVVDQFAFIDVIDVPVSTTETSNTITLSGINSYVYLTSPHTGKVSIDGGAFVSIPASGTTVYATSGQTIQVQHTSSTSNLTAVDTKLDVSGVFDTYTSTTIAAAIAIVNTPSISTPVANSTVIPTITITSSAYSVTGVVGAHASTDWEIYSDAAMTTKVASSYSDTTNKTSWAPTGLVGGQTYYVRVLYRSTDPIASSWSALQTFSTSYVCINPFTLTAPTNTLSVSSTWTTPATTLTATGDISMSLDNITFSKSMAITTGATIYLKWDGAPFSGTGIDSADGTTITGTITTTETCSQTYTLTVDKTPIPFDIPDDTVLQPKNTLLSFSSVTITGINSYGYITSPDSITANGVSSIPSSPTSGATPYIVNGDTLTVSHTTASTDSTAVTSTVFVNSVSDTFASTTGAVAVTCPSYIGLFLEPSASGSTISNGSSLIFKATTDASHPTVSPSSATFTVTTKTTAGVPIETITFNANDPKYNNGAMSITANSTTGPWYINLDETKYSNGVNYNVFVTLDNPGACSDGSVAPAIQYTSSSFNLTTGVWTNRTGLSTSPWGAIDPVLDIVWNGSKYVAVGNAGKVATSPNGITWTNQTGLSTTAWGTISPVNSIVWNGSQYVAVGGQGKVATSPDGITWTNQTGLSTTAWGAATGVSSIVWNGSQYIAVGQGGKVATSPDGITWTNQTGLSTTAWGTSQVLSIVWNGSQYVAVGQLGKVATSPDGVTWTNQTGLSTTTWSALSNVNDIVWNGSQYVAVGQGGKVATSTDGITWAYQAGLSATAWGGATNVNDIIWDGSQFVVSGASGKIARSKDGITWTYDATLSATTYGTATSNFIALGPNGQIIVGGQSGKIATYA